LYIDGHCLTHCRGPSLTNAKHVQVFMVLEPQVALDHLAENWGVLSQRVSPSHEQVVAQKDEALDLARELRRRFDLLSTGMGSDSQGGIAGALDRLVLLAETARSWCRLAVAHLRDMWDLPKLPGLNFDQEAESALALALRIEQALGPMFFSSLKPDDGESLPGELKNTVEGLRQERQFERPIRDALRRDQSVQDYVLCGLASEGHRLRKRLHSGGTFPVGNRFVRQSGLGRDEGFGYRMQGQPGPATLWITLLGGSQLATGRLEVGDGKLDFTVEPGQEQEVAMTVNVPAQGALRVEVWATGTQPLSVHQMVLRRT